MDEGGAWAVSGAMMLTGRADGPALGAPAALIGVVDHAVDVIAKLTDDRVRLDGLALLGERAAIAGLGRHGAISCGGGTRLLPAADGWLAVAFPRADDLDALPAWLEQDVDASDPWPAVAHAVARSSVAGLDERGALLALPVAAFGSVPAEPNAVLGQPVGGTKFDSEAGGRRAISGARVIDLSSLWAGPLCGQILAQAGADVIKVESRSRPDGARRGPTPFFDLLNGPKRSVVLDFASNQGRRDLARLVASADVVIDSSRPRALEQLGLDAADALAAGNDPRVWVSITGHGRDRGDRVAFGDVAAVAGGLVVDDERGPCFVADAVADPLTGLVAAAAVLEALTDDGRWLIDAGMAPIAARASGPAVDVSELEPRAPRARPADRPAPAPGADTASVMAGLPR